MQFLITHSWLIPMAATLVLSVLFALLCPSLGDSGPDGAAEFSILVMLWLLLNAGVWALWGICKLIF